jgi:hypothetical protein
MWFGLAWVAVNLTSPEKRVKPAKTGELLSAIQLVTSCQSQIQSKQADNLWEHCNQGLPGLIMVIK